MNDHTPYNPNYGYGQQPGPYRAPEPPRPPKKGAPRWAKIFAGIAVVGLLTVGGCTAVVMSAAEDFAGDLPNTVPDATQPTGSGDQTKTPTPPPVTPGPKKPGPSLMPRDGVLRVPSQVKPGRYETTVPTEPGMEGLPTCYIARLKGTSGELSDIISNQNRFGGDVVTLTIKATDDAVEIRGCGTWKRVK